MKQINKIKEYEQGVAFAILSSLLWGFLPIYWKSLQPIDPLLILFYRMVLASGFALILALIFYKREGILKPLKDKGALRTLCMAGILISMNWGTYIWAINNGQILQTSIGYYMDPLVICVFGILFFKERLNKYKLAAILLASVGVVIMLIYHHKVPTVALFLAFSWACYAAIKKKLQMDAVLALFYETILLVPVALIVIFYFELTGRGAAANGSPLQWGLLALAGIMTGTPLMLFAMGANRITLVTLGIIGYISPSISLLLGIFLYHEPFDKAQFLTFGIIWAGLAVFTLGEIKENRRAAASSSEPEPESAATEDPERFRLSDGLTRVTGGAGGEALLILGSEKTALIDCGMAYCGDALAKNIQKELGERPLDYVILTHTHYDHIGGLPYLRKIWPGLMSFGAAYGKKVLEKESARNQIKMLSENAWRSYSEQKTKPDVLLDGLHIDRVVCEKDVISLGNRELRVYETPGHTSCSLTFLLEPEKILFPAETIGVYAGKTMIAGMLKSYHETVESIEKCRKINANHIIAPHYGLVPEYDRKTYWDMALESVNRNRDFVLNQMKEGASIVEMTKSYEKEFFTDLVSEEQPKEAFLLNAEYMIKNLLKEFHEQS